MEGLQLHPFWTLAGREFYFPALVVVWHREPGGRDGLTVCGRRVQRRDGTWRWRRGWRLHVHHWRIQLPPLQALRRHLLTRCAWCKGRSRRGDAVNISHQWNGPRGRWWRGEPGLYHRDCSAISNAHDTCTCDVPVIGRRDYGECGMCGRFRPYGVTPERLARARALAVIPRGSRTPTP
ncbi:hypothetical protein ACFQ60_22515 [Streptomyces zhihengii]